MTPPSSPEEKLPAMLSQLSRAFVEIPFNKMLGLTLGQLGPNEVSMHFNMKEDLVGNFLYGILHGGVISSVLDMAGGMVVMAAAISQHSTLSTEQLINIIGKCSTVDLQISYLRPGRGDFFRANACIIKHGKKISFARMELVNHEGTLIATGNGTYLIKSY